MLRGARAELPAPSALREYRCRHCGWFLLASNAPSGRAELKCGNRRCGQQQTVHFGSASARVTRALAESDRTP